MDRDHSYDGSVAQQRHSEHCPEEAGPSSARPAVFRVERDIWNVNGRALECDAADERPTARVDRVRARVGGELRRGVAGD